MEEIKKMLHDNMYNYINYDDIDETFALKIFQNDLNFIKKNYKSLKNYKKEYFFIACAYSKRIDILDFLIDKFKININTVRHGSNYCLGIACKYNTNLEIFKHLIDTLNVDINHTNDNGENCFIAACYNNSNLSILNYFAKDLKVNIYQELIFNKNCLFVACEHNINLDIIKYLIEEAKINVNETNMHGQNCLMVACNSNKNLSIIKYLVENVKMNINHINKNGENCFAEACRNKNIEIVMYLIENTNLKIIFKNSLSTNLFIKIILMTKNFKNLNILIEQGITQFDKKYIKNAVQSINPWFLNKKNCNIFDVSYPYDEDFNTLTKHVDKETLYLPFLENTNCISNVDKSKIIHFDYSEQQEILFVNNGINYYGIRNIVYNCILFFKELINDKCFNFNDIIVLDVKVSKYIINLYIESCYTKIFDINDINPENLNEFLNFIDQYPSDVISINNLENDLINYMKVHKIIPDFFIKNMSMKYQLKYMYVHILLVIFKIELLYYIILFYK